MTKRFEHTSAHGINYLPNKKLGYYLVDDEIYYNKYHALVEGSKKNKQVRWFFNEDTFFNYTWHIEPEESLNELYRQRAQQLRDEYDYIRLECSGGSDSVNVAFSFLLNNIHLDEIVFRYPKQGEKDMSGNPFDTSAGNTLSEWDFAAKPFLDWVATNYPHVKITVHDYLNNMMENAESKDESWVYRSSHYLQPGHTEKHTGFAGHTLLADTGKKICVLYGVDKPRACIKDGMFFIYFGDTQTSCPGVVTDGHDNITNELFYWSPDCLAMLAKQGHLMMNMFNLPEYQKYQSAISWPDSYTSRTFYENLVKPILYDRYDPSTFQTIKPIKNIYNEMDDWFWLNFSDTKMHQTWRAGIDYLLDNLAPDYVIKLQGRAQNIMPFYSPFYYIGDIIASKITMPLPNSAKTHRVTQDEYRPHLIRGKLVVY